MQLDEYIQVLQKIRQQHGNLTMQTQKKECIGFAVRPEVAFELKDSEKNNKYRSRSHAKKFWRSSHGPNRKGNKVVKV